ncbi:hypothetical protein Godav_023407, partial [Gossypium davidsonii]|nr:hypothetical protein [Gossypium davidsonii]MBA0664425.1 hypothetical protein [Gossypium klotzschianum]
MVFEAIDTVDTMIKQAIEPNVVTYNALINGHCLQNRMDKARKVFHLMIKTGCAPDISRRVSSACELLRKMLAFGQVPNVVTCLNLLNGLCKSDKLEEALELFRAMRNSKLELNIVCYNILIGGLCKSGHIEVGKELFH